MRSVIKYLVLVGLAVSAAMQLTCSGEKAPPPSASEPVGTSKQALSLLTYTLGTHGINSLTYDGHALVTADSFIPQTAYFLQPDGTVRQAFDPFPTFTRNGNSFTVVSNWGTMFATYSQAGDSVVVDFGTYNPNTTDTLLQSETAIVNEIVSPAPAQSAVQVWNFAVDQFAPQDGTTQGYPQASGSTGGVPLTAWEFGTFFEAVAADPALGPGGTAQPAHDLAVLFHCNIPNADGCFPRVAVKNIGPGETKTRRFYLRFAPTGTSPYVLNADIFEKYNAAKPQQLQWDDRRPILRDIDLASTAIHSVPSNPRRYQTDKDLRTDAGKAAFRADLLARADTMIGHMNTVGAQGIVIGSIEGLEGPYTSDATPVASIYTGDPTRVALAPEMEYQVDGVATVDAYMQKFTDAGFRVGNFLRPQGLTNVPREIGTQFKPSVDGTITALRVYSSHLEANAVHTARLWRDSDGVSIGGPYNWTYGSTTGWVELDIPDVAVTAGTEYTVTVSTATDAGAYPVLLGSDTFLTNAGAHLSYRNVSVTTVSLGTRPADVLVGAVNALRDVEFVPAAGGATETLFGASSQPTDAYTTLIHYDIADPAQRLIDLIAYSIERWRSSVFFVDSTDVNLTTYPVNGETEPFSFPPPMPLSSDFFKRVEEAFPDVLVMPANQVSNDYPYTAPFDDGISKTVQKVTAQWPGAFSALRTRSTNPALLSTYVAGAQHGDIYLFAAGASDESWLNSVYQQAGHPPTARITSPADGTTIAADAPLTISASATDADGTVSRVEFYDSTVENGRVLLGQSATAPYNFTWSDVPMGRHVLSAHSVDNAGLDMWSGQVVVHASRISDPSMGCASGLAYSYYTGTWTSLPDFSTLTPSASGTSANFDLSANSSRAADNFGYVFSGYIYTPSAGTYTFHVAADEGSKLYIGNTVVVDDDKGLRMIEQSGSIDLEAGVHAITVKYFDASGADGLTVSYEGPNIARQPIPNEVLFNNCSQTATPGTVGATCTVDSDCGSGLVCGQGNGGCFGLARATRVCWAPACLEDVVAGGCGQPTSPCGQNCACVTGCDASAGTSTCAAGEVCKKNLGSLFHAPFADVCVDARCPSNDPALCGSGESLCGSRCVCTPNCASATCENSGDGCGGQCPGVCGPGATGCGDDVSCQPGFLCVAGGDGTRTCRPSDCAFRVLAPPLCGVAGAPCGDTCPVCTPQCDGRSCGPDPNCGQSCGTCLADSFCASDGTCTTPFVNPPIQVPDGQGGTRPVPDLTEPAPSIVGALRGTFSVSEQGTPQYSVPIEVPPGRAGMEPALSLTYHASRSNEDVGIGWKLEGLSQVTRCPHSQALDGYTGPVRNDTTDKFCIDGKRLEAVRGVTTGTVGAYGENGTEYRTLVDGFARVVSLKDSGGGIQLDPLPGVTPVPRDKQGPDSFRVWTKDGRILTYGATRDSLALSRSGVRYAWLLNRVEDHFGNTMNVVYSNVLVNPSAVLAPRFPNAVQPSLISYTGHSTGTDEDPGNRQVRFTYEPRVDPLIKFRQGGFMIAGDQRLSRITTFVDGKAVKNYHLQYQGNKTFSQVSAISECTGADDAHCLPPTQFNYVDDPNFLTEGSGLNSEVASAAQLDTNGDGITDFLSTKVKVDDVPADSTMQGVEVASDIVVGVGSNLAGPEIGVPISLIWDIGKGLFWGLFAKDPTITILHTMYIGTGSRQDPGALKRLDSIQGLPCPDSQAPSFIADYNNDGKDDLVVACGKNAQEIHVALSRGDGNFDALPADGSATIVVPIGFIVAGRAHAYLPPAPPLLFDVDGDSLQDLVSCADASTLQVRLRIDPTHGFGPAIPLTPQNTNDVLPYCSQSTPTYNIFDVDGDGKPDLLVRGSNGWVVLRYSAASGSPSIVFEPVQFTDVGGSANGANPDGGGKLSLADLNGDGLADIWKVDGDKAIVWLNTGGNLFASRTLQRPLPVLQQQPFGNSAYVYKRTAVLDYDGDGRPDLLENWQDDFVEFTGPNSTYFNAALVPNSSVTAFTAFVPTLLWPPNHLGFRHTGSFFNAADVDGDGAIDLFGFGAGGFYGARTHNLLLSRVTDGYGNFVGVSYDGHDTYQTDSRCSAAKWPEKCLSRMTSLVSGHTEGFVNADGNDVSERSYTYQYVNANMNLTGHGWLGFDRRIVSRGTFTSDGFRRTVVTDYEPVARYDSSGQPTSSTSPPYLYPLAGLPNVVRTIDGFVGDAFNPPPLQGAPFSRITRAENDWQVQLSAFGRPFPVVDFRDASTYDKQIDPLPVIGPAPPLTEEGALLLTDCSSDLLTDDYGNVTNEDRACQAENDSFAERTLTAKTFDIDTSNWLVGNPATVSVTSTRGDEEQSENWAITYQNGMVATITRASGGPVDQQHKTTYSRDSFGNPFHIVEEVQSGEAPRTKSITYDADNVYPATVTNALGQTSQLRFDTRFGKTSTAADPNGIVVQRGYDDFGRLVESQGPQGIVTATFSASTSRKMDTSVGHIEPRIQVTVEKQGLQGTSGTRVVASYDSHGQEVQTSSEGLGGIDVFEERTYDALGHLHGITRPHVADASAAPSDTYTYDHLDRIIRVDHSDGSSKQYQYAAIRTLAQSAQHWASDLNCGGTLFPFCAAVEVALSTDEEGRRNVLLTDYRGLVLRSIDGDNVDQTQHAANYAYGAFSRLVQTQDNLGHSTHFSYDPYGRRTKLIDPDTGTSTFTFNGYDELVSSRRPKGATRQFAYDDLGRITFAGDISGGSQWIYDRGVDAIGRLSETISTPSVENPAGQRVEYSYEAADSSGLHRGFLSTADYVLDGVSNPIGFEYDDLGRTERIHYPNSGTGNPIVAQYRYDGSGILVGLDEVGSNATRPIWQVNDAFQAHLVAQETFGNGASTTYGYNADRRWVENISTTAGADAVQTLEYTHFSNGLVHHRITAAIDREYSYDNLNRLASTVDTTNGSSGAPTNYLYDPIGNLTTRGTLSYTYDFTRPHLLATAGDNSFGYDANGNLQQRNGPDVPNGAQTIEPTPFDLPLRILGGSAQAATETDFEYTADEERVVRRDETSVRYSAAGLYERTASVPGGATTEERFRLYAGARQLGEIVRHSGSENVLFFHADAIGTVSTITDDTGASFGQEFDPFGSPVDSGSESTRAGFTGHLHDRDLGFVDMKGRLYDPLGARFTSVDPMMQAPFFTQGLNRYAYALNNPVNNVDPSGFFGEDPNDQNAAIALGVFTGEVALGTGISAIGQLSGFTATAVAGGWGNVGIGGISAVVNLAISSVMPDPFAGRAGSVTDTPAAHAARATGLGQNSMNATAQQGPVGPPTRAFGGGGGGLLPTRILGMGDPMAWLKGILIHYQIAWQYQLNHPGELVFPNQWLQTAVARVGNDPTALGDAYNLRPDILNLSTGEIYEIKPWGQQLDAIKQLQTYTAPLSKVGLNVVPGSSGAAGVSGTVSIMGQQYDYWSEEAGVILYAPHSVPHLTPVGVPGTVVVGAGAAGLGALAAALLLAL